VFCFGISATILNGTDYPTVLASNVIGWGAPWIASLLIIVVMGRPPKVSTLAQVAADTAQPSALGHASSKDSGSGAPPHSPLPPPAPTASTNIVDARSSSLPLHRLPPSIGDSTHGTTPITENSPIGNSPAAANRYMAWQLPVAPASAILALPTLPLPAAQSPSPATTTAEAPPISGANQAENAAE
jgi:hypothetical protein